MQLGPGYDYWLMKFDNVLKNGDHGLEDKPEYTLIEYAYYLMAKNAGIMMNECRLYNSEGGHHFMTKRFDRVNGKIKEIGLTDLLEAGSKMEIKERRCKDIISAVGTAVSDFATFAEQAGIKEKTTEYINSIIAVNMVKI